MTTTAPRPGRPAAEARLAPALDRLAQAVQTLRREYADGRQGRYVFPAQKLIASLGDSAATHDASTQITAIVQALVAYRGMPPDQREPELRSIADRVKALEPHLLAAQPAALPKGRTIEPVAKPKPRPRAARAPAASPAARALGPGDAVTALPGVGPAVAEKLAKLDVVTVLDLLRHRPRRYVDFTSTEPIGSLMRLQGIREATVRGTVTEIKEVPGKKVRRAEARVSDGTGWCRVTWFNAFVARQLSVGQEIVVSGALDQYLVTPSFTNPEWEVVREGVGLPTALLPVYTLTQGLFQKTLRGLTAKALAAVRETLPDPLPAALRTQHGLIGLRDAYAATHYPEGPAQLERATARLLFDDVFLLQLGLIQRKRTLVAGSAPSLAGGVDAATTFLAGLPFALTGAQRNAVREALTDVVLPVPMNRLLQGDVGSGKTVVAAAAARAAVAAGQQAVVMAPTEILAEQHALTFPRLFAHLPEAERPSVALLTGSTKAAVRKTLLPALAAGEIDILVGTHAVIQTGVDLARLGLVVIDEQHRFGVRQRAALPKKADGEQPHVLAMTATPIPRTLNMVLFGDMDVSVIDEMPPGRIPIETRRYLGEERYQAYDLVREQVALGHQVFVICPLVEESDTLEEKAAVAESARLQEEVFPDLRVALLHGRMPGREKERVMHAMRDGEFDILVATSVIEVGIDIPNATVMIIEGADRFGLAQLHQFRGRVGRGGSRSYCLLLADDASLEGEARLGLMVETTDGFALAEQDLKLRGPGDFLGTRQSGLPDMPWLQDGFDTRLLEQARRSAERLLEDDPTLSRPEHLALAAVAAQFWSSAMADIAFR